MDPLFRGSSCAFFSCSKMQQKTNDNCPKESILGSIKLQSFKKVKFVLFLDSVDAWEKPTFKQTKRAKMYQLSKTSQLYHSKSHKLYEDRFRTYKNVIEFGLIQLVETTHHIS